ncbi:Hypothetical_protein [Hexamita inflata]|uniref:Hypothetical_protein n=1 Tax=Hexamita inflata TaxID=28002 RepID=A0AA86QDP5_9EUKA|nr:Hypothetical protein HINF_LOCUS38872 [Hexamita inflata]
MPSNVMSNQMVTLLKSIQFKPTQQNMMTYSSNKRQVQQITQNVEQVQVNDEKEAQIKLLQAQNQLLLTKLHTLQAQVKSQSNISNQASINNSCVLFESKSKHSIPQEVIQELDELRAANLNLKTDLQSCRLRMSDLQTRLDHSAPAAAKFKKAAVENLRLRSIVGTPGSPVTAMDDSFLLEEATTRLEELTQQVDQLSGENYRLDLENQELKSKNYDLVQTAQNLFSQRVKLEVESKPYEQQIHKMNSELTELQMHLKNQQQRSQELEMLNQILRNQNEQLNSKHPKPYTKTKTLQTDPFQSLQLKLRNLELTVNEDPAVKIELELKNVQNQLVIFTHQIQQDERNALRQYKKEVMGACQQAIGQFINKIEKKIHAIDMKAVEDDLNSLEEQMTKVMTYSLEMKDVK